MSYVANKMARTLWFYMLWLMRRPWMKRLQRRMMGFDQRHHKPERWDKFKKQNKLALRYGLKTMVVMMNIFVVSAVCSFAYSTTLFLYESGALTGPTR